MRILRLTFDHPLEGRHGCGPLGSPLAVGSTTVAAEQQGGFLISMSEDNNPRNDMAHRINITDVL